MDGIRPSKQVTRPPRQLQVRHVRGTGTGVQKPQLLLHAEEGNRLEPEKDKIRKK